MKELITEWRKFLKEVKSLEDLTKDKGFASGFEKSSARRRNAYEVIQAFIKNSNEVNNLFQDSLKYMVNNDFDIYTPSGYSKPEFKAFAKKIAKAIGKKIKEEGVEKLIKDFGLPETAPHYEESTYGILKDFEQDAERISDLSTSHSPRSVDYTNSFLVAVNAELKEDPEQIEKVTKSAEMEPYEAPMASDMEDYDFELDAAKKIRNYDPDAWKKDINENKKRKNKRR